MAVTAIMVRHGRIVVMYCKDSGIIWGHGNTTMVMSHDPPISAFHHIQPIINDDKNQGTSWPYQKLWYTNSSNHGFLHFRRGQYNALQEPRFCGHLSRADPFLVPLINLRTQKQFHSTNAFICNQWDAWKIQSLNSNGYMMATHVKIWFNV